MNFFANGYDMLVIRWVSLDPGVLIIPFHSRNIPQPGKFKFWARYANAELDQLLEDAESAETQEVKDDLYANSKTYNGSSNFSCNSRSSTNSCIQS